jgi:para-aminobenzoate synthetase component 1
VLVVERDWIEPAQAAALWAEASTLAWLDSADAPGQRSRYSYLAPEPFSFLTTGAGGVLLDDVAQPGDPFTVLERVLEIWHQPIAGGPTPFCGGAIGWFGYGLAHHLERLPRRHLPAALPDMAVGFHDVVIAFDHQDRRCWICASGLPETGAGRERRARARLGTVEQRLRQPVAPLVAWSGCTTSWHADLDRPAYEAAVGRVLAYIGAGDLFQANLTTGFRLPRPDGASAFGLYSALRLRSPAPFAAYLAWGKSGLLSASPERFLSLDADGQITTRPIKGTRPRGETPAADLAAVAALRGSAKDRAENLMIVDLMRNDLGRVAATGSIAVPLLCEVESFAAIHHLVSEVTARLRPGLGPVDLLRASFPGGSVTGAPKIRAMEVIDEIEAAARGAYCGAVAWIGWDGAMDSSIVIRTLSLTPTEIIANAGGGIVADSDPAAEYEEMRLKLAPLLAAVTEPDA